MQVVPDVMLSQNLQDVESPKAATISRSVLNGILNNAASLQRYKICVEQARFYDRCATKVGADKIACQLDKALVNVGAEMLQHVSGAVSTELDPRLAHDTDKLVARGRQIMSMYAELNVSPDRVILRMPATWEAIQAAHQLEREGFSTHIVLVYSFVQGVAAAQAGIAVIQPNVGKLNDWYTTHPGVPRDPKGPREARAMAMAGYGSDQADPGLLLVEKLYAYCKLNAPKTRIMASGLRNKDEVLALAGCDYLVVGPKVLEQLNKAATLDGYNDGLRAGGDDSGNLPAKLSADMAKGYEFDDGDLDKLTAETFGQRLGLPGKELLEDGIKRLVNDADRLEPFFLNYSGGQE